MTSFSGVTFVLFCFVFVFMLSLKPRRPFVQSSFDMQAPRYPHVFLYFVSFCLFGDVVFSEYFFVPLLLLFLCMESMSYVLSSRNGVFLPCDHGLDF